MPLEAIVSQGKPWFLQLGSSAFQPCICGAREVDEGRIFDGTGVGRVSNVQASAREAMSQTVVWTGQLDGAGDLVMGIRGGCEVCSVDGARGTWAAMRLEFSAFGAW